MAAPLVLEVPEVPVRPTGAAFYHFSVDDVFDALIEASDARGKLFEQPLFGFLKGLHEEFGALMDLYVFYRKSGAQGTRTLREVSDAMKPAFADSPWLRLAPHGLDVDTPPYLQSPARQRETFDAVYREIERFAGDHRTSRWLRLHCFSESVELAEYFRKRGVDALFTTDKDAVAYRLPKEAQERLQAEGTVEYEGLRLIRSDLRVEGLVQEGVGPERLGAVLDALLSRKRWVVLLTHEYELARPEVRAMTIAILRHLATRGVRSV